MAFSQFQSVQGPTDSRLRHTELEGYQPVSRIGEVVINSFVDSYEFARPAPEAVKAEKLDNGAGTATGTEVEFKPHFHEWATVLPGMICLVAQGAQRHLPQLCRRRDRDARHRLLRVPHQ